MLEVATPGTADRAASLAGLERTADGTLAMFVAGEWTGSGDGGRRPLVDPSTDAILGYASEGTPADAERAIAAARRAFDDGPWPRYAALERARLLSALADRIDANRSLLTQMETLSCGKPLRETDIDVVDAANCFRYFAGLATKPHGQALDVPAASQSFVVQEPIGVCGQIVPWNYPLLMATWKLAPALAAGNVCILKPSELTPFSALWLAKAMQEIGFPDGVLSVVTGGGPAVGAPLAESFAVDKIAFTGSVATGRSIMRAAAGNLKKISLELGGKSPNVIFADADWDTAIDYALFGIYANAGQVCSAGSRLLVERAIAGRFVTELVARAKRIVVGDGFDPATEMGPLVHARQRERVEGYISLGIEEGAVLATGGHRIGARGNFIEPTIFTNVRSSMTVAQEEIFGPVLVVLPFDGEDEALRLANDTIYGLAGAVFTTDGARAQRIVRGMRAGVTWVNTYHPTYNEAPWGGYKQSGLGRELGTYGYDAYTEVKQINVNLAVEPSGWFKAE